MPIFIAIACVAIVVWLALLSAKVLVLEEKLRQFQDDRDEEEPWKRPWEDKE